MKALHALAVIKDARDTGRLRAVYDVLDEIDACDFDLERRCLCEFAGCGIGGCECARACTRELRRMTVNGIPVIADNSVPVGELRIVHRMSRGLGHAHALTFQVDWSDS